MSKLTGISIRRTVHRSIKDTFAEDDAVRAAFVSDTDQGVVEDVAVEHVVMAAGHSARELFECLASKPATAAALRMVSFQT